MSRIQATGSGQSLSTVFNRDRREHRASQAPLRHAERRRAQLPHAGIETLESRTMMSSTWFVALNGSDANNGTINAPFRTIQHAADVTAAGDTVAIRGGVYHETVTMRHSGTAASPIVFEPYNGESVTIDGADAVSSWQPSTGAVWTAPMKWNLGTGNNQVFVDGKMINEARWPNTSLDLSHPTLAVVDSATNSATSSTIRDASLTQPSGFWVGATMHIDGGQQWVMRGETVTASGPGWVTFTYDQSNSAEMPTAGNHYYLTGKAGALDSAGEWYRNANGTLSLWTPAGDSPTNHVVEVKARAYAFDLSSASNIRIEGIHVFAATINTSAGSRNIAIDHITAEYLSQFDATSTGWAQPTNSGIVLKGIDDTLSNSVIAFSAGDGVYVSGSGSVVTNNLIHDVDYQAGESGGVNVAGSLVTVDHNTIYNCGRSGIVDRNGGDHILSNVIHNFGLQTTDCGGIYTFGCNGNGAEFAYNTIYNGITGGYGGAGVYLDNNSSGFIVDHNVTYNVNTGLKMNMSSTNQKIYNNTFDGTSYSVNKIWGPADWSGTIIENNLFPHATSLGAGATVSHNLTNNGHFANAAAGNYQLVAGAPAIGAGLKIAPYTNAYGTQSPDLGALRFGTTPVVNGATLSTLPADSSQTPPVVSSRRATSLIVAVDFSAKQGTEMARDGGLGNNLAGNWVQYSKIDFGTGLGHVTFRLALDDTYAGRGIALRLDSPTGPTIGTVVTVGTGGWTTYAPQTTTIAGATGVHDLYLVMLGTGAVANIQSFQFSA